MHSAFCCALYTHGVGVWCQGMYMMCAARVVCLWFQGPCIHGVC